METEGRRTGYFLLLTLKTPLLNTEFNWPCHDVFNFLLCFFIVDFLYFLLLASGQIVDSDGQEDIEENVVAADEKHDEIEAVSHQLAWSTIFSLCFAES